MRIPKRWALALVGGALAAALVATLMKEPEPTRLATTESEAPAVEPEPVPSAPQPGGIDPLGASQAIRRALESGP